MGATPGCGIICRMCLNTWTSASEYPPCGHTSRTPMLRKRGKYWHYQFEVDGVAYWGSTREAVKTRAEMFESIRKTEIRQLGGNVFLRKAPTLMEFSKRFLEFNQQQLQAGSIDKDTELYYRNGWRLLKVTDVIGMRMDQIGTPDAAVLSFPGGPSNANTALRTLRRMLSYAAELGVIRAAPKIKLREEHGREGTIEPWMERLLLKEAPDPLADVLILMLDCGMRPEEVLRMRWEHISWERDRALVPHGKSLRSRRYVPMSNRVRSRLRARQAAGEWVFPADSTPGYRTTVSKQWLALSRRPMYGRAKRDCRAC